MSVNSLPSSTVALHIHPQLMIAPGIAVTLPGPTLVTARVRGAELVATGGLVNALRSATADGRSLKSLRSTPKW